MLASGGGFATGAGFTNSFTVGQGSLHQTFTTGTFILTQGFQQPADISVFDNPDAAAIYHKFVMAEGDQAMQRYKLMRLAWDLVGIATGVFVKGDSPLLLGIDLAPQLPLEEPLFLAFLSYLALVAWAGADRLLARRARADAATPRIAQEETS